MLELFQVGYLKFGGIDVVLANAGINGVDDMLESKFDSQTGKLLPPNLKTLDVNLLGVMYTVKCAVHYFAKVETPCQLVLTGSAAW